MRPHNDVYAHTAKGTRKGKQSTRANKKRALHYHARRSPVYFKSTKSSLVHIPHKPRGTTRIDFGSVRIDWGAECSQCIPELPPAHHPHEIHGKFQRRLFVAAQLDQR
jgi:hypothetical protein